MPTNVVVDTRTSTKRSRQRSSKLSRSAKRYIKRCSKESSDGVLNNNMIRHHRVFSCEKGFSQNYLYTFDFRRFSLSIVEILFPRHD